MSIWTLGNIRTKIRRVTGRLTNEEMTNEELDDRINKYYQYTFPAEVKLERQHSFFDFLTVANQATYDFEEVTAPLVFTNIEPPATVDNLSLIYYQDPGRFNEENPYQVTRLVPWSGNGFITIFDIQVVGFPIFPGTLVITDNFEIFEDTNTIFADNNDNIEGNKGGKASVDYSTGAITVTFNNPPSNGQPIFLSYILFQAGRPTAVLFYDNTFKFFVPPNTSYRFQMKGYKVVDPLVDASDTPTYSQWGPAIAYGTARDIHSDFGEFDAYEQVTKLYKEQLDYVMTRTDQNLMNIRAAPFF